MNNALKTLAAACGVMVSSAHAQAPAAAVPVSGSVVCTAPGKPELKFSPKMAAGFFVVKTGEFAVSFFAEPLKADELRYWLADEVNAYDAKLDGKDHDSNADFDKRLAPMKARAVRLWGELKDHSKYEARKRPDRHEAADFSGMQLTACSNFGYLNAGLGQEDVTTIFKTFSLPTPTAPADGAKMASTPQMAQVDLSYRYGKAGGPQTTITLKGSVPVYFAHD